VRPSPNCNLGPATMSNKACSDKSTFQKVLHRAILLSLLLAALWPSFLRCNLLCIAPGESSTDQVIDTSDRIYRIRVDQEAGLRAYLLTSDEQSRATGTQRKSHTGTSTVAIIRRTSSGNGMLARMSAM
jgi:hypothetical protein